LLFPIRSSGPSAFRRRATYDPEFFALERERLWPRVWQMACRLEEIPEVGDYVEYEILGQSVIVVRTAPDRIRAYHNACRHRGMRLVQGRGNAANGLVCPFHGWCWNLDGSNRFVFAPNLFREDQLDPVDLGLRACRLETWGGCAFVNFDDDAPPLRPSLEPFATYHDAFLVDRMRAEAWFSTVLPVNWKLASEAFMEGYHATQTHPQLLARSVKRGLRRRHRHRRLHGSRRRDRELDLLHEGALRGDGRRHDPREGHRRRRGPAGDDSPARSDGGDRPLEHEAQRRDRPPQPTPPASPCRI
jgi:phenylpropionate dioxygenase-like ring-hydroxylating dioxygenase large terminal subunit